MEKARISGWQFFLLTFMQLIGTTFFLRPGGLIAVAKQDAWMVWIWSAVAGIIMAILWIKLEKLCPGLSIIQISIAAGGKVIGGFIALLYIGFFVHLAALIVRNLGDFMKATLMPRTPISVFHFMLLIVACYAVVKGVETIARTNELLTPIIVFTFIIVCSLMLGEWNAERLKPAFRLDVWRTMKDARDVIGFPYIEGIALMMMYPLVNNKSKSLLWGYAIATLFLSGLTYYMVGIHGITRTSHETYPLFIMVKEIRIGPLIENLEATITMILLIAIFGKLSITFYAAVTGICQLFLLEDRKWVSIPLVLIVAGLALSNENIIENITWVKRYLFEYEIIFGLLFPLLFLILIWFCRQRIKK